MVDSPIKWHGGKHYLASKIVGLMPKHIHYVEPFFGGGSVLFAKNPEGVSEVINDIDLALTNFWWVLQGRKEFKEFQQQIWNTPFSEVEWEDSDTPTEDHVERACRFFIRCRQSMSGRMNAFTPITKSRTRRGMNEQVSAWLSSIEGLPEVHERLQRVVILNQTATYVINTHDAPRTLFYLDPPYLATTRTAKQVYNHEMSALGHQRLLDSLKTVKGKFLLSGYPSALYDSYGWKRHDFDLPNNAASGGEKRRMTECVWTNF